MWTSCLHVAHIFLRCSFSERWSRGGQVGWLDCCLTDIREGGTKNKKGDGDRCKLAVQKIQKEQGRAEQHCWSVPRVHKTTRLFFERTRWKMYEIWKQFNQIWLYLSSIQDILCVCLRRYFLYVIRSCSRQWLKSFLSFSNKEQLPQTSVSIDICDVRWAARQNV